MHPQSTAVLLNSPFVCCCFYIVGILHFSGGYSFFMRVGSYTEYLRCCAFVVREALKNEEFLEAVGYPQGQLPGSTMWELLEPTLDSFSTGAGRKDSSG